MRIETDIEFNEEIQVAHRLLLMPGKCQNIHGHGMTVSLTLCTVTKIGESNVADIGDFGKAKKVFRDFLRENLDHKLLLNANDPWAQPLETVAAYEAASGAQELPGLVKWQNGDPTTESIAYAIANWAHTIYNVPVTVRIDETSTNAVAVSIP